MAGLWLSQYIWVAWYKIPLTIVIICFIYIYILIYIWLVVWNMAFLTFHILGIIKIIIHTDELIFFTGVGIPPTRVYYYIWFTGVASTRLLKLSICTGKIPWWLVQWWFVIVRTQKAALSWGQWKVCLQRACRVTWRQQGRSRNGWKRCMPWSERGRYSLEWICWDLHGIYISHIYISHYIPFILEYPIYIPYIS